MSAVDDLREWVRLHPQYDFSPTDRQRINLVAHNADIKFPAKRLTDEKAADRVLQALKDKYGD